MKKYRLFQARVFFVIVIIFLIACKLFFPPVEATEPSPSVSPFIAPSPSPTNNEQIAPTHTLEEVVGFTCPAPREVRTVEQLINLTFDLVWVPTGEYTTLPQGISEDIKFLDTVTLDVNDIPVPPRCLDRTDCRASVVLDKSAWLDGVECLKEEPVLWMSSCTIVKFEPGDVLRLRASLFDTHPAQWNYVPKLELIQSCPTPCRSDQFRCSADNVCWNSYDDYCRLCLGQQPELCACQSGEGDLPEGSECQYWISGDVLFSGKCVTGVCR